jgi:CRP-like cAMP-binding protein
MDLVERIKTFYNLTIEEIEITKNAFTPKFIPAKTYFLEEGKIANEVGFIASGLFRSFFYDDNANDITTHFFQQGTVVLSMKSFNNQVPSKENIVAMEDSHIYFMTYEETMELYKKVPAWRQITKDVDEMKFNELMNRSIQLQTLSAKERYDLFCQNYPDIIQKVALKHIASYLGIDIATLSRIRKKM